MDDKKNKIVYFWFGVFAACFICFQSISSYIRPNYTGQNEYIKYLLGIAPNFFPAIGIPALILAIILQNESSKPESKLYKYRNLIAVSISTTGLIAWEFVQTTSRKLIFDVHDILWTLIGSLIFIILCRVTRNKQQQ